MFSTENTNHLKKNEIEISKIPIKYMQSGTFNTSS